jgi:hypothetical protein
MYVPAPQPAQEDSEMTVQQLIELLKREDQDAEVMLAQQPSWPFEYSVRGVVARREFDEPEDDECRGPDDNRRENDVFIVEGSQLRYGHRDAFDAARR